MKFLYSLIHESLLDITTFDDVLWLSSDAVSCPFPNIEPIALFAIALPVPKAIPDTIDDPIFDITLESPVATEWTFLVSVVIDLFFLLGIVVLRAIIL
jgi:hypothetical protein